MKINTKLYAKKVLQLKGVGYDSETNSKLTKILDTTFKTIYKAIAFDIDGTLTKEGSSEIDVSMAEIIGRLLIKGVPVLLISGRGRGSIRDAVSQILKKSNISYTYIKRLNCIAHNGVFWLKTEIEDSQPLLNIETVLVKKPDWSINKIKFKIEDSVFKEFIEKEKIIVSEEPKESPYLLRINVRKELAESERFSLLAFKKFLTKVQSDNKNIFLTQATYAGDYLFNISNTNKILALKKFAEELGIDLFSILRIGDSGEKGGNDFDLLNSRCGFSVSKFNSDYRTCFPILDEKSRLLNGVQATKYLLNRLNIFPPLTLKPNFNPVQLKALHTFEKLAFARTKIETSLITDKIRIRLHRLFDEKDKNFNSYNFTVRDIFDKCGGILFYDWEVYNTLNSFEIVFGLTIDLFKEFTPRKLKWCMFTDTKILMRGSNYYFGLTSDKKATRDNNNLDEFIKNSNAFVENAIIALQDDSFNVPSFTRFKLLLSIIDNVRNILLVLLHATYICEIDEDSNKSKLIYDLAKDNSKHYLNALFNENISWTSLIRMYLDFLKGVNIFESVDIDFLKIKGRKLPKKLIRKWREADNFLENTLAVSIAINEFHDIILNESNKNQTVGFVGLDYGGIELPLIAQILCENRGLKTSAALLKISIYSNSRFKKKALNTDKFEMLDEFDQALESLKSYESPKKSISKFIILDDNCTTARTLELTRNLLLRESFSVLGAIIVRYPGSNRYKQMRLRNHGLPDPEILLSFVRGLVTPSPYSRLLDTKLSEDVYLDKLGIFDKARRRIEDLLIKNGESIEDRKKMS